jgi:methionyl-tRNA synthetase
LSTELRICALEGCFDTFIPPRGAQHKKYCTERHQRIAEKRRFRERHTEIARCPGCDELFSRSTVTRRKQKYCSSGCMADCPAQCPAAKRALPIEPNRWPRSGRTTSSEACLTRPEWVGSGMKTPLQTRSGKTVTR